MIDPSRKLRVGLLLNSLNVPGWVHSMIARVASSHYAEIVLVVTDDSPAREDLGLLQRVAQSPASLAQRALHHGLSALIWGSGAKHRPARDAFAMLPVNELLRDVPRLAVRPVQTTWSDRFSDVDVAQIKAQQIDVLIRIGFRILRGDILNVAKYGVWSYHHGDNRINRGGPPGFWESMEAWPLTGCTLQVLSEDLDNGLVLARTWSTTVSESVVANNQPTYWKSLSLIPRQLELLHRKGAERFFADARAAEPHPQLYSRRLYRSPSNRELLRLLTRKIWRTLRRNITSRFSYEQWILLFHLSDRFASSLWRYQRISPPADRFWADPFIVQKGDDYFVFFEDLPFRSNKGHISVIRIGGDGTVGPPQVALMTDHHLSYPFIFEANGETYMIPESRAAHCVSLYRCVEFPARWEKVMNLMENVEAVDATLHFQDGRWWMFVNMIENPGASSWDELYIFHAEHFATQNWQPHPANPVVSDVRSSRPAGRLFMRDGQLYRPSQDSSQRYGWAFNINHVEHLDTESYAEKVVSKATPSWARDVIGTHTFNSVGRLSVIDAEIRRRRWPFTGPKRR